jgi:hypothetical protein
VRLSDCWSVSPVSGDTTDAGPPVAVQQELPSVHTQKATPPSASASDTKEAAAPEELLSPDTNNTVSLLDDEPLIKSPPEPTRVKSPEQIIMRSPEPVNWTVPLDTGKTFTVTQNVREGESITDSLITVEFIGDSGVRPIK